MKPAPRPAPLVPATRGHRLFVVMPALNEAATVADVVAAVPRELPGVAEVHVLVVDDGSTDGTGELARAAGAEVVRHPQPMGVGAAFQSGVGTALERGADLVVNIDSDGQFDPADIPRLLKPVLAGEADMVTASRFKDEALAPRMPRLKRWGNAQVARIVSALVGERFHDVACGFRAFNREALLRLNLFGKFTYTQEVFLDLAYKGLRILEVPTVVRGERQYGESRVASSLVRYARNTLKIMLGSFKDYRPFAFFFGIAGLLAMPGLALAGFFGVHYLQTGRFSPHLWAGFLSAFLLGGALVFVVIAVTVESQARNRMTLERLLYLQKRQLYAGRRPHPEATGPGASDVAAGSGLADGAGVAAGAHVADGADASDAA